MSDQQILVNQAYQKHVSGHIEFSQILSLEVWSRHSFCSIK